MDINIIVSFTQKFGISKNNNVPWVIQDHIDRYNKLKSDGNIIIIDEYKKYISKATRIYATLVLNDFECDKFFPTNGLENYCIVEYSKIYDCDDVKYRFITYERCFTKHMEYVYLNTLCSIMQNGTNKINRTMIDTRYIFGCNMSFDISKYFPLITTKKVSYKNILRELLWFISGSTDNNKLVEKGVNIWSGNTTREFLDERGLNKYVEGDLGPMYGVSFRSFGCEYKGCKHNHLGEGYDQLEEIVKSIRSDPYSRRHLMTTFNPAVIKDCVLAPCHGISIQFNVDNNMLSCAVYNRSQDMFLGVPYNIASYALLTYIIAKKTQLSPYKLIIFMGDTHIYINHCNQVLTQLSRNPLPWPVLDVKDTVVGKKFEDIQECDFELIGYMSHEAIPAQMAI